MSKIRIKTDDQLKRDINDQNTFYIPIKSGKFAFYWKFELALYLICNVTNEITELLERNLLCRCRKRTTNFHFACILCETSARFICCSFPRNGIFEFLKTISCRIGFNWNFDSCIVVLCEHNRKSLGVLLFSYVCVRSFFFGSTNNKISIICIAFTHE